MDLILPDPEPCLVLSCEDIETRAEGMDVKLSREEIITLFDTIVRQHSKHDGLYEIFWDIVTQAIEDRNKV